MHMLIHSKFQYLMMIVSLLRRGTERGGRERREGVTGGEGESGVEGRRACSMGLST